MTKPKNLLCCLFLIAIMVLWACIPTRLAITPSPLISLPTPSAVFTPVSSPTIPTGSPTLSPPLMPTEMSAPSSQVQNSISIWRSYVGLQGQEDHLIFHVVIEGTLLIPTSIQILDAETGQLTNLFPIRDSPFPNLCAAEPMQGKLYYRTKEVFFADLPPDFWERLSGTSFTYLIELEQPTGEQVKIAITDAPGGCMNLVQ